ncbi:MAG TPA: pectinesterase family protein [Chitinophagaceae bacterium]|nr:pectinesterase family protein [Chitinophagaceae bacterium]HQX74204.1 pectinesterase family protein [Chitinophagaceae bacterium]
MKKSVIIVQLLLAFVYTGAQSTAGITGTRDTSYNITNEYNKHLKNYPNLQIVKEFSYPYITEEKNISYCKTNERELKLDVFSPSEKSTTKRTAILFIHGGGWRSGNKAMHYPLLQQLAALGYVCITPEYRLSTEALYPAAVHDIKSAIRWVRKNTATYNIDVNRIVVAGHSAGGELAAFMGATNGMPQFEGNGCYKEYSSKANAVIDADGTLAFIHQESGEGDDSKRISAATHWFGYSRTENPDLWKQAAPLTHVGKHTPPTQFINSGVARMHAGREDFVAVLKQHKIYSETKTFEGSPHSFLLFNPWFDTTVVYMDKFLRRVFPAAPKKFAREITVAQDGSGDYKTVQAAINAVPVNNNKPIAIIIKKGIYKEKILIDSLRPFITLIGEDKLNTVLTYNDHTGKLAPNGDTINTRTSWSFKIMANNFTARDITFQNDAGFSAGQAVAVESDGDKAVFINCRFTGNQDVLFTNSERSRQYYEHCYIEGTTDFIFGSSTVWFEKCHIYSKKNSHITAASTPREKEFGYVFNWSRLDGDSSLVNVSLGRPWRPYAAVAYLHCYIGRHIKAEGWSVWNKNDNHLTSRYAEYNNFGPSSDPEARVKWAKHLTAEEAKKYTLLNVLRGWNPLI